MHKMQIENFRHNLTFEINQKKLTSGGEARGGAPGAAADPRGGQGQSPRHSLGRSGGEARGEAPGAAADPRGGQGQSPRRSLGRSGGEARGGAPGAAADP